MPARKPAPSAKPPKPGQVAVRTPNVPGHSSNVDAAKYHAMKALVLKALPRKAPGLTQAQMFEAIAARKDAVLFPKQTHTWWGKCVQLDLEAQGVLVREAAKPLRWHRA